MHAFFAMRGIKRDHDEVVKYLETRSMPMPITFPDGTTKLVPISSMLQPITLWSFVFPEHCKDAVLTSLQFDKPIAGPAGGSLFKERIGNAKAKVMAETLRLALGASKIPEFKKEENLFMPLAAMQNVQIIPIGVKYDKMDWKDPANGSVHEAI